ncbi:MAG: chromate efflux transporter, partial [Propionibacteriaceae bacterium]|nr:chromate efflux transporter [Propionibacteriaceae bacterium]
VAVVAQAVWSMGRALCADRTRLTIAFASAAILLAWPGAAIQVLVIAAAAAGGALLLRTAAGPQAGGLEIRVPVGMAAAAAVLFVALLVLLPLAAAATHSTAVAMFDTFYRAGALVFGGGHVVLPLLQSEVVPHGWVDNETFLAGYGAAQAVPGPLFTFAAYLGAASGVAPNGWAGALLCLAAIFLPSLLLVLAALPYWQKLRQQASARAALAGVNASVVGLLLAALYQPVWVSAIGSALDFALALGAFLLLVAWRWSPLWVVGVAIAAGAVHGTMA